MAGIRTCDRESQVQRPNHYTTDASRVITTCTTGDVTWWRLLASVYVIARIDENVLVFVCVLALLISDRFLHCSRIAAFT